MARKIVATINDHDFEQLVLLARLNKIKVSELVRRLCRAYLDQRRANPREELINER